MSVHLKKPGRNAPCPCGSGKKFKQCCLLDFREARNDLPFEDAGPTLRTPAMVNRVKRFEQPSTKNLAASWKHVYCQLALVAGGFVTLTLAYTTDYLHAHDLRTGRFLSLDLPDIGFSGRAFIIAIQDAVQPGSCEGELLLAMERREEGDFGVMVYGGGPLAQEVMDRRRELSREIILKMEKPDGGRVDITLMRFATWLESQGAAVGQDLFLDMPEMGVQGWARVLEIRPCPPLELPGTGPCRSQLITGTFRHSSGEVYDLKLSSESEPIGVTFTHPFWSEDRQRFVPAGELYLGETLNTWNGTTVVESFVRRPGCEDVYNLEVEGDHVYRVGESGVLVHNASFKACDPCEAAQTRTESVGGFNVNFAHVKHLGKDRACRIWKIDGIVKVTPSNPAAATSSRNSMRGFFFSSTDPLPAQTTVAGTHDAGHLVADSLGGPNDYRNLVPMLSTLNRSTPGAWRRMEEFITSCLGTSGANAQGILEINIKYADGRPFHRYIPTSFSGTFLLTSTSGDKLHTFSFSNTSTEQPKNFGSCF